MSKPDRSCYVPGMFDTHAHLLPMAEKGVALVEHIEQAVLHDMLGILDVGITPNDLFERSRSLRAYQLVRFAVGLHPTEIKPDTVRQQLDQLARILSSLNETSSELHAIAGRVVAIGEIGLDYYWDTSTKDVQRTALIALFEHAARLGLPVILHNRESETDMLDLVRTEKPKGVMHCFSQDREYCRKLLDAGMYISFGGNVTYRRSDDIRGAAAYVPEDRLLVETDSPYLSPQDVRGKTNHPGHLGFTIQHLAAVRGTTAEAIAQTTSKNARALFR